MGDELNDFCNHYQHSSFNTPPIPPPRSSIIHSSYSQVHNDSRSQKTRNDITPADHYFEHKSLRNFIPLSDTNMNGTTGLEANGAREGNGISGHLKNESCKMVSSDEDTQHRSPKSTRMFDYMDRRVFKSRFASENLAQPTPLPAVHHHKNQSNSASNLVIPPIIPRPRASKNQQQQQQHTRTLDFSDDENKKQHISNDSMNRREDRYEAINNIREHCSSELTSNKSDLNNPSNNCLEFSANSITRISILASSDFTESLSNSHKSDSCSNKERSATLELNNNPSFDYRKAGMFESNRPSESEDSALPSDSLAGSSFSPASSSSCGESTAVISAALTSSIIYSNISTKYHRASLAIPPSGHSFLPPAPIKPIKKEPPKFEQVAYGRWKKVSDPEFTATSNSNSYEIRKKPSFSSFDGSADISRHSSISEIYTTSSNDDKYRSPEATLNKEEESPLPIIPPASSVSDTPKLGALDFSRYNSGKVIGRIVQSFPQISSELESESEVNQISEAKAESFSVSEKESDKKQSNLPDSLCSDAFLSHNQPKSNLNSVEPPAYSDFPTTAQIETIQRVLGSNEFPNFILQSVTLNRLPGVIEGSVGLLLTSPLVSNGLITVSKVITGSVADKDGRIIQGDRLFFIQNESTENMSVKTARCILKAEGSTVSLVIGRNRFGTIDTIASSSRYLSSSNLSLDNDGIFSSDPAQSKYSENPVSTTLIKSELGFGFTIDGGTGSQFGDRPIVVKRIFTASEAAKDGRISLGDEIRQFNDTDISKCSRLEALRIIKSLPDGPVKIVFYKRVDASK